MSVGRRKYDSDFKRNAVLLLEEPWRTVPKVAENLGINSDLYISLASADARKWRISLSRAWKNGIDVGSEKDT